jgi:hypothetical protein
LAFFHIRSVLWLHVQGEENSVPSYLILYISFMLGIGKIVHMDPCSLIHFSCSARSQLLKMSLWICIMKSSLGRVIVLSSSSRNEWRRQWSKLGRTITQHSTNIFLVWSCPWSKFHEKNPSSLWHELWPKMLIDKLRMLAYACVYP